MLLGATGVFTEPRQKERLTAQFAGASSLVGDPGQRVLALLRPWGVAPLDAEERVARDMATGSWLAFSGHLYRDLASGREEGVRHAASLLLGRLSAKGVSVLGEIDGSFAIAFFDGRSGRLHLVRDRFGEEPLFYGLGSGGTLFGSRTRDLVGTGLLPEGLCPHGLAAFLSFGFVPGEATLDAHIRRVPAGGAVVLDGSGNVLSSERWARPVFLPVDGQADRGGDRLRTLLEEASARRSNAPRAGVLLAPDDASRGVAALARLRATPPLPAFDLCTMLRAEKDILAIEEAVASMDVPVSDPGLDVASWIAGREATGEIDLLVAGSGAEEIFASHPSYAAQARLARIENHRLAALPLRALQSLARGLGSPDDPDAWRRTWRDLLPPAEAPQELGAFRWRVLFAPNQLLALTTVETAHLLAPANPWKCVLETVEACDAPAEGLSRDLAIGTLAGSPLALGRGMLLRRFGIETRSPCYDPELVEYAALAPGEARLPRQARGRALFAATLADVLPTAGAALPEVRPAALLKRWLAGSGDVGQRVAQILSKEALRARGLFRPEPVQRLLHEHRARRHDHTGRLWALVVLELWLRARSASGALCPE